MHLEIFNRYEYKYQIVEDVFYKLQERLLNYMDIDIYNRDDFTYPVSNLYCDTDDSYLIRTSLEKPRYKEKLRIRSYGVPKEDSVVFAEIKKKFGGLVNKRRSSIRLCDAYDFLQTGVPVFSDPNMNEQVIKEIGYMISTWSLKPSVFISYNRRAFFGIADGDLRVSFDTDIITRRDDLRLEAGVFGERILPDGIWLMEIKVLNSIPLWLTKILSEYQIVPMSFSKYGTEYAMTTQTKRIMAII